MGVLLACGHPALAADPVEVHEAGISMFIYPEEFDGDENTADAIVRVVDWRTGYEGWVYARVSADGEVDTWEPTIEEPVLWQSDATRGPGQRFYDGVDCWDTPAQNERFGKVVREAIKRGIQAIAPALFRCAGTGLAYWNCVAFAGVTPYLTATIWDTVGYLWTCHLSR